ncbi:MAG: SGNH/GDSL hydrolase family protein, partial [Acetanaerobacterium sp.]
MNIVKQIQIYGDSIMKGILLDKDSNRYYPMKHSDTELFQSSFDVVVNNRSKFGCTIERGWQQLARAMEKGLSCDMVLLEYGGNDCDYDWERVSSAPDAEHEPHTPIHRFKAVYRDMLAALKEKNITPIVMSLPPIDGERYFKWITRNGLNAQNILRYIGDVQMIYRFQEMYSLAATKIAYETQSLYVDVRSAFLDKRNYKDALICEDGIHPNENGHRLIS